jgi:polyisoprenoid-binding protein YceI
MNNQIVLKIVVPLILLVGLGLSACSQGEAPPNTASAPQEVITEESVAPAPAVTENGADAPSRAQPGVAAPAEADPLSSDGGQTTFTIVPERSEARFFIDEVLLGSDKTVIGVTSKIVGQLQLDPVDLSRTHISPIQIDASDLTTDDNRRNRALRQFILQSDQAANQFIVFEPTAIAGLPETVAVGETVTFNISGNLIIRGVSRAETFAMTASAVSVNEVTGLGTTTIKYADYGISMPKVPAVASVEEEVRLEIELTAVAEATTAVDDGGEFQADEPALANSKLNLNQATAAEFQATIPNFGERMVREFLEYRPYISIQQFRREIGKYVDAAQVTAYEQYVFVPIKVDEADAATLQQLPGVSQEIANTLIAARPYGSNEAFLTTLAQYVSGPEASLARSYLVNP